MAAGGDVVPAERIAGTVRMARASLRNFRWILSARSLGAVTAVAAVVPGFIVLRRVAAGASLIRDPWGAGASGAYDFSVPNY
jgi:hypothetical protein